LSAAARDRAVSADEVITAGLRALAREEKRRAFEETARRLGSDPDDRAEVAAAIRDVLGE
jgi:Arc/MetJ-type ribon-helix-helix transcriptional regulator